MILLIILFHRELIFKYLIAELLDNSFLASIKSQRLGLVSGTELSSSFFLSHVFEVEKEFPELATSFQSQ